VWFVGDVRRDPVAYDVTELDCLCRHQYVAGDRRLAQGTSAARATQIGKVRKAFWLDPRLLDQARASLGTSSERGTATDIKV
jgi:hypothetical protein